MTTRLVLLQGGLSPSVAPLRSEMQLSATEISQRTEIATEKNSGWVVPRPQRWTTPYSTPSELISATGTIGAYRLRGDLSAVLFGRTFEI